MAETSPDAADQFEKLRQEEAQARHQERRSALLVVVVFVLLALANLSVFGVFGFNAYAEDVKQETEDISRLQGYTILIALQGVASPTLDDLRSVFQNEGIRGWRLIAQNEILDVGPEFESSSGDPRAISREDLAGLDLAIKGRDIDQNPITVSLQESNGMVYAYLPVTLEDRTVMIQLHIPGTFEDQFIALLQQLAAGGIIILLLHGIFLLVSNRALVRPVRVSRGQLATKNVQLQELLQENEEELRMARAVQQSILPEVVSFDHFRVAFHYDPMNQVSGDIIDFSLMKDGSLLFFLGDVSGHGIPSAMITTMAKVSFRNGALMDESPAKICQMMNEDLAGSLGESMYYLTGFVGRIYPDGKLVYANATHPDIMLVDTGANERWDLLGATGFYVGVVPGMEFEVSDAKLAVGQRLVIYSDGITEAEDESGRMIGDDVLQDLVKANRRESPESLVKSIVDLVESHRANYRKTDDVSILVVDYVPPEAVKGASG